MADIDEIVRHYLAAAEWTDIDEDADWSDMSAVEFAKVVQDCTRFVDEASILLVGLTNAQIGHDFWLTRNGHGAGFWDRGLGERGELLSEIARAFGPRDAVIGDDGLLYME